MPYKDPEQQREYQRQWSRMKRAGESSKPNLKRRTLNPAEILTAQGIRDMLAEVLNEVMEWEGDTLQRARCVGYVAGIAIKAVETADLEQRITELEQAVEGRGALN